MPYCPDYRSLINTYNAGELFQLINRHASVSKVLNGNLE